MWGPNYHQAKKYRWNQFQGLRIDYVTEFRLAFSHTEQLSDTTAICRLSVYYKYIVSENLNMVSAKVTPIESVVPETIYLLERGIHRTVINTMRILLT